LEDQLSLCPEWSQGYHGAERLGGAGLSGLSDASSLGYLEEKEKAEAGKLLLLDGRVWRIYVTRSRR
jgi:hypothetical protein